MAYGTPTDPVAGTVITVAYAVANILDPIRWLRQMTGNADPPGSNYVVVSSSTTGTAWSQITTDLINNGAVTDAKLATPKVTKAGDTMSGMLDFSSDGVGVRLSQSGTLVDYNTDGTTLFAGDDVFRVLNQAANVVIFRAANADAAPTFKGYTIWHSNNDGTGSGLDADTVDGSHASAFALAAAGVPSGLIAMVTNAAAIPSGWSRESGLNGRVPVGDDLGVTYTAENNYGSATHTHSASALGVSGSTGGPSATDGLGNGGGTTTPTAGHTHNQGSLDVTGTTDATANLPLARAYVFVKKD